MSLPLNDLIITEPGEYQITEDMVCRQIIVTVPNVEIVGNGHVIKFTMDLGCRSKIYFQKNYRRDNNAYILLGDNSRIRELTIKVPLTMRDIPIYGTDPDVNSIINCCTFLCLDD